MKSIKNWKLDKKFFVITTVFLALLISSIFLMGMKVDTSPNIPMGASGIVSDVTISIEKPTKWLTKETKITITVDSNTAIKKVEAKTTNNGQWQNITDDMTIEIVENCTVYVQVTDKAENIYTKSRYIEVFDRVNPTIKAKLDKNLLHVEANDDLSGVFCIYVNGIKYEDLNNDTLDLRITSKTSAYETISVQVQDNASNKSNILEVKNPYYKDDSTDKVTNTQASTTTEKPEGSATTSEEKPIGTGSTTSSPSSATNTPATAGGGTSNGSTTTSESSANDSGSSGGESSDTPKFGTYEDTTKQFLSIVTKDGQVFYMIIDHDKPSENVYFLTEVNENDLKAFTNPALLEEAENEEYSEFIGKQPEKEEVSFIEEKPPEESKIDPAESEVKEVPSEQAKGSSHGTIIFVVILIALVAGAGYYFKIYKPKKELENADDLDDFEFEEDTDDWDFSDSSNRDNDQVSEDLEE